MLTRQTVKMTTLVVAVSMFLLSPGIWAQMEEHEHEHAQTPPPAQTGEKSQTLEQIHTKTLPSAFTILASLQKAIESGNQKEALTQLNQLKHALMLVQVALAQHVGPTFVNATCPIFGTKIDPAKVTPDLIREFNGQKVAFCCAMCPPKWDALTDAEKKAKLMAAVAKPDAMPMSEMHDMHEMHEHEEHAD